MLSSDGQSQGQDSLQVTTGSTFLLSTEWESLAHNAHSLCWDPGWRGPTVCGVGLTSSRLAAQRLFQTLWKGQPNQIEPLPQLHLLFCKLKKCHSASLRWATMDHP